MRRLHRRDHPLGGARRQQVLRVAHDLERRARPAAQASARPMKPPEPVTRTRVTARSRDTWRRARTASTGARRPLDPERRVVPAHAARRLGHVVVGHLVVDLGVVGERTEAVREPRGDEERRDAVGAQLDPEPARNRCPTPGADRRRRRRPRRACSARAWPRRAARPGSAARAACPRAALNDVLHCAIRASRPAASNSAASNVRAKNPRSSRSGSSSTTYAPASGVGTSFTTPA